MKPNIGQGDNGKTSLIGGEKVRKDDYQVDAYGDIDELNSHIGLIRSINKYPYLNIVLEKIQENLFVLGSQLAAVNNNPNLPRLTVYDVKFLEEKIMSFEKDLPKLRRFILPTGTQLASMFHVARTICRRAERRIVELSSERKIPDNAVAYTNRLSDLLFNLARWSNYKEGKMEKEWISRKN